MEVEQLWLQDGLRDLFECSFLVILLLSFFVEVIYTLLSCSIKPPTLRLSSVTNGDNDPRTSRVDFSQTAHSVESRT